jgi:Zn-dependent protease with chaperone function
VFQSLQPAITVLIALAPAGTALAWGRSIRRHLDDPLLAERLFAKRRRTGMVFGAAIGLLLASALDQCVWAIPLLVLSRMAAGYPLRKMLHNETWSLGAYLSFFTRLFIAVFGLWMLLLMLPFAAKAAGPDDWIVGLILAAIAVAWHRDSSTVFRWLLGARTVDDQAVVARFGSLLKECGLSAVSLEQVDLHGGAFANAVALASIRSPAVVITDTLLARLDRDETIAILAHELAHLEFYTPSRLRRNSAIVYGLAAVGALWSPVLRVTVPQAPWAVPLLWPVLLFTVSLFRVRHRQKHETESDLRAVVLTGDPEAVVRALTKLHAFARLPRRRDAEFERHATHPSLARRLQAIRAASEIPQTAINEAATFSASQGAVSVTFHEGHLEWRDGRSASRRIEYGQLEELRIRVRVFGHPRLIAVDSAQRRSEMSLAPGDVARVQSLLDTVDARLAKAALPGAVPVSMRRVLSLLAIFSGLAVGHISVLIAGLLELVRPAPQMAAALGASAVTAAVLTWRDGGACPGEQPPPWVVLTLSLAGTALLGVAFASRREATLMLAPKPVPLLACCVALAWVAVLLHVVDWPTVSVITLGGAGALAFSRSAHVRWAAVPMALAGVFAAFFHAIISR